MNAIKVDVLAELDEWIAEMREALPTAVKLREALGLPPEHEDEKLTEIRDAIAELIATLRMSDEWIREAVNFGGCRLESSQTLYRNRQALARVGGAA
jgi:hypothetical protein